MAPSSSRTKRVSEPQLAGTQWRDIFQAAMNGDFKSVKCFVEDYKIDVNSRVRGSGETALHKAAQGGHLKIIEYLISKGSDVNMIDKYGYNALLWAIDMDRETVDVVNYLLNVGSDKSTYDLKYKYTAIHFAACHGRLDVIQSLVEKGFDPNARTKKGDTALLLAADRGHIKIVSYLLDDMHVKYYGTVYDAARNGHLGLVFYFVEKRGISPMSQCDEKFTAMHLAARSGKLPVVKYFLEKQAMDVNLRGNDDWTPLMMACSGGHMPIVQYLLDEKSADMNSISNSTGVNPLLIAADKGRLPLVKYLIDEKQLDMNERDKHEVSVLHYAAASGSIPMLKYLLEEKNMDMNVRDHQKYTVLHYAARAGNLDATVYLVENKKYDLGVKDLMGNSPLKLAVNDGYLDVIGYLLDHGADIMNKDYNGNTVFHNAAGHGKLDVLRYLLDMKQVDVNVKNYSNETPLLKACENGHLNVVRFLIDEKKADMNIRGKLGNSVLHLAASANDDPSITRYLIDSKKFDMDVRNDNEETVLMYAARYGKLKQIKYLIDEKKMNFKLVDKDGYNVLHRAAEGGHCEVVRYLVEEKGMDTFVKSGKGFTSLQLATKNEKIVVVKYFETLPSKMRVRRSIEANFVNFDTPLSPTLPDNSISTLNLENKTLPEPRGLIGEYNSTESALNLTSTVALMNVTMRYLNGNKYEQPKHESLWSPRDMIERRIDTNALHAIHSMEFE